MSETKKITLEELNKAVEEVYMPVAEINWNGLQLCIKRNISFQETLNFVDSVIELCFAEDTNEYLPEVRDLAIRIFLVNNYTNVELPDDIAEQNNIVYNTDLVHTILSNIDGQQFNSIIQAIDMKLQYLSGANIAGFQKQMDELYSKFEQLSKTVETIFSGLSVDSMSSLVEAIKNGKLDEGKLMQAYFENKEVLTEK